MRRGKGFQRGSYCNDQYVPSLNLLLFSDAAGQMTQQMSTKNCFLFSICSWSDQHHGQKSCDHGISWPRFQTLIEKWSFLACGCFLKIWTLSRCFPQREFYNNSINNPSSQVEQLLCQMHISKRRIMKSNKSWLASFPDLQKIRTENIFTQPHTTIAAPLFLSESRY